MFEAPEKNSTARPSILIIEDAIVIRLLYKSILAKDYELVIVEDGDAALGALQKQHFDLVVTDANLPTISGPEVIRVIRHNSEWRLIPIVVVSCDTDAIKEARAEGADAWILKPIKPDAFCKAIKHLMQKGSQLKPVATVLAKP